MVRASAYPTVEWLTRKHSQVVSSNQEPDFRPGIPRAGRATPAPASVRSTGRANLVRQTALLLEKWSRTGTSVVRDVWIRTPNGEEPVDLVVERNRRRIGIRLSNRYERDTDQSDALVLVYGRFDTLNRVSEEVAEDGSHDMAYILLAMVPSWFTPVGRIQAGRQATPAALLGSDQLAWRGQVHLKRGKITRIRLSRSSDWVIAFERALSPPVLTKFADARKARLQSRP